MVAGESPSIQSWHGPRLAKPALPKGPAPRGKGMGGGYGAFVVIGSPHSDLRAAFGLIAYALRGYDLTVELHRVWLGRTERE